MSFSPASSASNGLISVTAALLFILICVPKCVASEGYEGISKYEHEYKVLYDITEDKDALEAIRDLHRQLDDDQDGTIEPSETGDFIKADLQYDSDKQRQKNFHKQDAEITVKDLWVTWHLSEVYNWTTTHVVDWIKHNVDLPQYAERFQKAGVNGTQLPKAAVSSSYLSKVLGITNPIHRSKINLKAMDVVLFGPPRDQSNFWKDAILTSLLVIAVTGLLYAYRQNKKSQDHLRKMMQDMDSLSKAEEALMDLQQKLQQKDSKIESLSSTPPTDLSDVEELGRLREEVEILRNELQRAEVELEDKCWVASPVLQHWLQMTYELESATYDAKKKAAEDQLELAKDMCERLKKKRSSLVGAFVSTHGRSIDDVDRSILEAKTALMDLTTDLTERSMRWKQIEMLCGCSIINNPGLNILRNLVRHVGAGRFASSSNIRPGGVSRLSNSISQDDMLEDSDAQSISASSHMTSTNSNHIPRQAASLLSATLKDQHKKRGDLKSLSRESSKDTSSSDDIAMSEYNNTAIINPPSTPPLSKKASPAINKRSRMVKSYSQDAAGSIQDAVNTINSGTNSPAVIRAMNNGSIGSSSMTSSVSESHLQQDIDDRKRETSSNLASASSNSLLKSKVNIKEDLAGSCSTSEAGSTTDLNDKKNKKRSIFTFGRKKDKKGVK